MQPQPQPSFIFRVHSFPLWLLAMLALGMLIGGIGAGAILDRLFFQPGHGPILLFCACLPSIWQGVEWLAQLVRHGAPGES